MVACIRYIVLLCVVSIGSSHGAACSSLVVQDGTVPSTMHGSVALSIHYTRTGESVLSSSVTIPEHVQEYVRSHDLSHDDYLRLINIDTLNATAGFQRYEILGKETFFRCAYKTFRVMLIAFMLPKILFLNSKKLYESYAPELMCAAIGGTLMAWSAKHYMSAFVPVDEPTAQEIAVHKTNLELKLKFAMQRLQQNRLQSSEVKPVWNPQQTVFDLDAKAKHDLIVHRSHNKRNKNLNAACTYIAYGLAFVGAAGVSACVQKVCVPPIHHFLVTKHPSFCVQVSLLCSIVDLINSCSG